VLGLIRSLSGRRVAETISLRRIFVGLLFAVLAIDVAIAANPPLMVIPGQFSVSSTGAATNSIPIMVPPGTSGVVPALSLAYSSQNGDGFVGLGWTLSGLSSITRCPRTLAQDSVHGSVNYNSNDRFCMDGQRLMLISGSYGADGSQYRTEIESFSKIIAHGSSGSGPAWFEVHTKAGQIMEFGNTSDSRALVIAVVSGTPPANTVREWMVSRISDVVGNYMTITYSCAPTGGSCISGEAYPTRIDYTGNASASVSPYNSVRFEYTTRGDSVPVYQAGGVVRPTVVLTHIKTYQAANLVQDYQLAYRAGTSILRSHLTSVTQCDNASHCLPATTFGWQGITAIATSHTTPSVAIATPVPGDWNGDGLMDAAVLGSCEQSSWSVYLGQPVFDFSSSSYTLANPMPSGSWPSCRDPFPGSTILAPDGTSDIVISVLGYTTPAPPPPASSGQQYVSVLTTAGPVNIADYTSSALAGFVYAGDYNGDGIVDFFSIESTTGYAYLGSTSGTFTKDSGVSGVASSSIYPGDFDGDGCTDIMALATPGGGVNLLRYAYHCAPAIATVTPPTSTDYKTTLGDFNGDGKTDILYFSNTDTGTGQLWLASGTGFVAGTYSLPIWSTVVAIGDWNGDGKADVLIDPSGAGTADYALYVSTGTDFTPALDGNGDPVVLTGSAGGPVVAADWNNDGNTDVWLDGGFVLFNYTPELMTSVSNGVGSTTTVTYDRINQGAPFYSKGVSTYPTQDMIGPQYVVKEVDASNGLGTCNPIGSYTNCYRMAYAYGGAKKDLQGRGFLGFSTVAAADLQTSIVQTTAYCTNFPLIGLVSTDVKVHSAVTLSSVTNYYNGSLGCAASGSSGVNVVQLTRSDVSGHDLNGATLPSTATFYTYDSYSNPLTVNISVSDGSSKNTTNTYSNDTTNWFLGRLLTTSVNSIVGGSNMTRQSSFAYSSTTGLLTQESIEPGINTCNAGSDSCTLTTSYTYDAFGHRVTTTVSGTGIATRTSYAFYDSSGEFMTSAANALGQRETWAYDQRFGSPVSHSGPNFLTTTWAYDSFGRLIQEAKPDGTQTDVSYTYCDVSCPANGQFYATSRINGPGGWPQIGPISYAYYDMLSRGIANDSQGFDGSNIRVATVYDADGRVQQTSRPYFTASISPKWTQFAYDDLGRVTQATFPDSSIATYVYNGLATSATHYPDPTHPQTTTTVKNAQGLNATVTDATSHITSYVYDAFGDLLTVTDPNGNVIRNTFDIRGNKVASQDPDMGRWTYTYDVLAELISQTDAQNQTTILEYDLLGRTTKRTENGLYSIWTYGASASDHNVGQIIRAKACTTSACTSIISDKTYVFDGQGRESQFILQTANDNFGYRTTYDSRNGQIASITYPSGSTIYRRYNSTGFLTQLRDDNNAFVWTINSRDAELHITSQTAGNGVTTTQAFDPNTGLIENQRAGSGNSVASFEYTFDTIGNLKTRKDANQWSNPERFCYDSLNRLTNYNIGAACTGTGSTTVSYDAIGNITSRTGVGTYNYNGPRPHAVTSITGTVDGLTNPQYIYDGNGNLTCVSANSGCGPAASRLVNLTSFNMAAAIVQGTNSLGLAYDDQHQRLKQVNTVSSTATTTTLYLNDAASGAMSERVTTSTTTPTVWNGFTWGAAPWGGTTANSMPTWTDYITIDGQVVAQRKVTYPQTNAWGFQTWNAFTWGAPGISLWGSAAATNPPRFKWGTDPWSASPNTVSWSYFNLDHLGSVAVITNQSGSVVQRRSFDAWGKQRNPNGTAATCGTVSAPTTRGFTNQEEMPTQCLVNLNARLYDASIGKFMAADSIVPDAYNGQSYNRYAYVTNNPLSLIDPTGHEDVISTGFRPPGLIGAGTLSLSGGGVGYGDSDIAFPQGVPGRPPETQSQENQTRREIQLPSLCSRAGGAGNNVCSGSYATGFWVRTNSSGENTDAKANADGNDETKDTNGGYTQLAGGFPDFDQRLSRRVQDISVEVSSKMAKWAILGAKGEFAAEEYIRSKGYTIVGRQLFVQTPLGFRITDFLITGGNLGKALSGVEVKVNSADRSALQVEKDLYIRNQGGEVRSQGSPFKGQTLKYDTAVLGIDLL
jgi:RHS repeat-associated protein